MFAVTPRTLTLAVAAVALLAPSVGCVDELEDVLSDIEFKIFNEVDTLQRDDPRDIILPAGAVDAGNTVVINNNVTVVNNIREDIVVEELPDVTLVGFENLTGLDAYYVFLADGEEQSVFVYDGETLLLEYFCLFDIELIAEEYYDPFDGALVEAFDLADAFFVNPDDFICGDAVIFTFDDLGVIFDVTPIDLLE